MTKEEAENLIAFKNYCTCGGFNREGDHPHTSWCAQFKEYEEWWAAMHEEE